ncbi:hypothetical protein HK100_011105 [Physocladia obscura]|uniref:CBS domain-containing protein n=1 Tax=Physocladia obscura TaxID=109957 RepID=A0AAD5TAA9_9FUNG|nr:hypothetical protein HK100_011105 [Physocladia obscura]
MLGSDGTNAHANTHEKDKEKEKDKDDAATAVDDFGIREKEKDKEKERDRDKERDRKKTLQSLGALLSEPVIVVESAGVSQVCHVMAARRVDAVLLVDSQGSLAGILTGGDVSRRIVAAGLDTHRTKCSAVMTPSPLAVRASAPVSLALRQMVARRCRHLPVLSDEPGCEEDLAGLLDITQCVFNRIKGLDPKELSRMDSVTVGLAVANSMLPLVGASASIRDACIVMRDARHTGVLVVDENDPSVLIGILTNKDVILRVLGANKDPETMTVQEAMTPHPDFVSPTTSVLEALNMLGDGHYLHLPVIQENKPVGLVDLLTLTMSILDYILKIDRELFPETQNDSQFTEGPLWNRFWNNSATNSADDNLSQIFSATAGETAQNIPRRQTPEENDIEPLDDDDAQSITSAGAFYRKQKQKQAAIEQQLTLSRHQSGTPSMLSATENLVRTTQGKPDAFVFKLHDLNGTIHRFTASASDFRTFMKAVEVKTGRGPGVACMYKSPVTGIRRPLLSPHDLVTAVSEAKTAGAHRLVVMVVEGDSSFGPLGRPVAATIATGGSGNNGVTLSPRAAFEGLGITNKAESSVIDAAAGGVGNSSGWVLVNVGGVKFETKASTLIGGGSSFFGGLFGVVDGSAVSLGAVISQGEVKVDRDGELFRHVLYFLRNGVLSSSCLSAGVGVLKDLIAEAEFYGVGEMKKVLQERVAEAERVVVVTGREELLEKLGSGYKVLLVEEEGKRYIMKREA